MGFLADMRRDKEHAEEERQAKRMVKVSPDHPIPVCNLCNCETVYIGTDKRFLPGSAIRRLTDRYECPKCKREMLIHEEF